MSLKNHLILGITGLTAWSAFYLIGISSDYYSNWTYDEKLLLTLMAVFSILPFICFIVCILMKGEFFRTSIYLALYASVGAFILDYFAVGVLEDKGIGFLFTHWYLSIGYISALIVMPITGYALKVLKIKLSDQD